MYFLTQFSRAYALCMRVCVFIISQSYQLLTTSLIIYQEKFAKLKDFNKVTYTNTKDMCIFTWQNKTFIIILELCQKQKKKQNFSG